MKSFVHILAAASFCISGLAQTPVYNSSIYNGGDYSGAGLISLELIANLSQAIVTHSPSHDIFNTSDIIIGELK